MNEGDLHPQSAQHRTKLERNVARSNHHHCLWQLLQKENRIGSERVLPAGNVGHDGTSPGGNENPLG